MLVFSAFLLVIGSLLLGLSRPRWPLKMTGILLTALSLFGLFLYAAIDMLTENGLDESFFYHFEEGLKGANLSAYDNLLWHSIALYLFTTALLIGSAFWLARKHGKTSPRLTLISLATLVASIICNPATQGFYTHYFSSNSEQIAPYYIHPKPATGAKRNLLYIYLESLEQAYLDEKRFPGLTPHLHQLMQQGLVFDNIGQTFGAEWTIAGMVASQCGIPLTKPGKLISAHGLFSNFLPKATCLGDSLRAEGYKLHYLAGANTSFASKGSFYSAHGFEKIEGLPELEPTLHDASYKTDWGLLDDTTMPLVLQRFNELSKQATPFALVSLTLDTHSPFILSRSCQQQPYRDGKEGMLNAVHCTDLLLSKLIKQLQQNPAYDNTLIVIGSDHTGMNVSNLIGLKKSERNNFLLMLNSGLPAQHIAKRGTTLDIAATVLPLLGAPSQPYGLGRNLLAPEDSLASTIPEFGTALSANRHYFHQFWSFPTAKSGLYVTDSGRSLHLGEDELQAPVLISLDKNLELQSQFHLLDGRYSMLRYLSEIDFGARFLWLDRCADIQQKGYATPANSQHCLAAGKLGGQIQVINADQPLTLTTETLNTLFGHWPQPWHYFAEKKANINLRDLGTTSPHQFPLAGVDKKLALLSSVNPKFLSVVRHDDFGYLIEIEKGLRVVGISKDQLPSSLYRLDCQSSPAAGSRLKNLLADSASHYEAIAIIYRPDDSCTPADYQHFFEGSGFTLWHTAIGNQQPYIAIRASNGQSKEFTDSGNSTAVRL